jgi:hypothetical protein
MQYNLRRILTMVPFCCVKYCTECDSKQHICSMCGVVNMHETKNCESSSNPLLQLKDYVVDVLSLAGDKIRNEDCIRIAELIIISSPHNTMQLLHNVNKRSAEDAHILSKKFKHR